MKTSRQGQDFIKNYEKLRLKAYLPTKNDRWTIGWGSTFIDGRPVMEGEVITREKAQKLFDSTLKKIEDGILSRVDVPLNQDQFDALVSLVYNIGVGNFSRSTLLKKLNKKDYNGAQKEFSRWVYQSGVKLNGLIDRREKEADIFGVIKKRKSRKKKVKTIQEIKDESTSEEEFIYNALDEMETIE
jgi:lysozyme